MKVAQHWYLQGKELKTVKFVEEYNKSLIDEAEDDIDRVIISEGI